MSDIDLTIVETIGWVAPKTQQPDLRDATVIADVTQAVETALAHEEVGVIVFGSHRLGGISSSAEPAESPVDPASSDALNALCALLESSSKPVTGLMSGRIDLDVLSVMLACHYRLADVSMQISLPRWFGAATGHTQRLPHLVGARAAIALFSGDSCDAVAAQELGLVDGLARSDLPRALEMFLEQSAAAGLPPRPSLTVTHGTADAARFYAEVEQARQQASESHIERLIECVEGALLLPFEIGRDFEAAAAQELYADAEATGNARLRQMQTLAWAGPKLSAMPTLCLIGMTDASFDWVQTCVDHGLPAKLYVSDDADAGRVAQAWQFRTRKRAEAVDPRDFVTTDESALQSDFIINTQNYQQQPPPAEIAALQTNTGLFCFSTAFHRLDACAKPFGDKSRVIALTLARDRKLLEWSSLEATSSKTADGMQALAAHLKLSLLKIRPAGGFLSTRIEDGFVYAIEVLLAAGFAPNVIDEAFLARGWSSPPLAGYDRRGLKLVADRQARMQSALRPSDPVPGLLNAMVQEGETGRRAGMGFYRHSESGLDLNPRFDGQNDQKSRTMIRDLAADGIADFVICVMAHVGARCIGHGFVTFADAVDLSALANGLTPAVVGGPMAAVEQMGLDKVIAKQERWSQKSAFMTPTWILKQSLKRGSFPRVRRAT